MSVGIRPLGIEKRVIVSFLALAAIQVLIVVNLFGVDPGDPMGLLILAALTGVILVVPLLLSPSTGILLVPLLLIIPVWFFGFTVSEIVLLGAVFFGWLRSMASAERVEKLRPVEVAFALYVLWAALTLFQAVELKPALAGLRVIGMQFIAFLAGLRLLGRRRSGAFVQVIALLGILIGVQLVALVIQKGYSFSMLSIRVSSLTDLGWGVSNYVGAVAALTTAASIPLAFYGHSWGRFLGIGGLSSAVFVSIATLSRGGTLAIAVGLLVATALEFRRRFLLALLLVGVLVPAYVYSPLGQATLERFFQPKGMASVAARLVFYEEAFQMAKEHTLFGVGPNQIPFNTHILMGPNPHNFLLKNAVDLGVAGLSLYLVVLGMVAARIGRFRRLATREARLFGLCLTLLLSIGLTNALYEPTLEGWVFGCVFWLTAGALYRASEDRDRPEVSGG